MREPPNSIEAERSVLGAVLLRNDCIDDTTGLRADDFFDSRHRMLWGIFTTLHERNTPIDPITIESELGERVALLNDGLSMLSDLVAAVPTADNVAFYADIIKDKAEQRRLILYGSELVEKGYREEASIEAAEKALFELSGQGVEQGARTVREVGRELFTILQARESAKDGITGVKTGFEQLDHLTAGLQPATLNVLAARPGMGKTALAMTVAINASLAGARVLFVSLEMSSTELMERAIASEGSIDLTLLRTGQFTREMMQSATSAYDRLLTTGMEFEDAYALTIQGLRRRARKWWRRQRSKGKGLIVIDYLQLMTGKEESREQEIAAISRGLKALSKELHLPILALAQLSRGVEARQDKRPMLSDLRESGAIEQDADVVMFIYRDEYYHKTSKHPGVAEINIAKQRSGPTGTVNLAFRPRFTRFENLKVGYGY